jgi:hypothetical protein
MLFEDFAKKKYGDYISLIQPSGENVYLKQIRDSALPPFIINFFERTYRGVHGSIKEDEFKDTLNRAVIFSINYVIKPKNTLLKFLFGEYETRPADYIQERLGYFLFYNYYINHIENFINLNSPETVSVNQVEHLVNVVNKQILDEISNPSNGDAQRLNLVKLLYIFFLDLAENNPINIKLPKKILSAFFKDKGYAELQNRIDRFFSEEIFIQEAVELMKPKQKKTVIKETEAEINEKAKKIISKAKTALISAEASNKDIERALQADAALPGPEDIMSPENITEIKTIRESDMIPDKLKNKKIELGDELYSHDLILESQLKGTEIPPPLSGIEINEKLFDELFCEQAYRRKILKKVFAKDENFFREFVFELLKQQNWKKASRKIDEMFTAKNINYFSEEAVKFVDIMQYYFTGQDASGKKPHSVGNS